MPVTTSKRKQTTRRKKAAKKPSAKAAECRDVPVTTMEIPIGALSSSPFQPRQEFPQEQIEQLGESILADGLIHPIVVRPAPVGDGYELIDGERRLRASQWLGRNTIRAEVGDFTDAQAMRIVVASALQRADLNPIEQALAFKRAIDSGVAAGPTELARQLGVSQGHVSNRMRMLELPDDWQARVISGEIPPTYARHLVKYREFPGILAKVARVVCEDQWEVAYHCKCTVGDFAAELEAIAEHETRPLAGKYNGGQATRYQEVPVAKFTEEQLANLQVIEIENRNGKPEERAANVDLWETLQAEFLANRDEKAAKRAEKASAKKQAKDLTAAEKRQLAREEAAKAKERERVFQKRLYDWYMNWLCYLIGKRLRVEASMQELLVIATYFTCRRLDHKFQATGQLPAACKAYEVQWKKRGPFGDAGVLSALVGFGEMDIEPALGLVMADWFYGDDDVPHRHMYDDDLERLVTYLVIDRKAEWREDQAGPLSEAYWNLHSKDQLLALAKELGVEVEASAKKGDLVAAFMARDDIEDSLELPKELENVKRPK